MLVLFLNKLDQSMKSKFLKIKQQKIRTSKLIFQSHLQIKIEIFLEIKQPISSPQIILSSTSHLHPKLNNPLLDSFTKKSQAFGKPTRNSKLNLDQCTKMFQPCKKLSRNTDKHKISNKNLNKNNLRNKSNRDLKKRRQLFPKLILAKQCSQFLTSTFSFYYRFKKNQSEIEEFLSSLSARPEAENSIINSLTYNINSNVGHIS